MEAQIATNASVLFSHCFQGGNWEQKVDKEINKCWLLFRARLHNNGVHRAKSRDLACSDQECTWYTDLQAPFYC